MSTGPVQQRPDAPVRDYVRAVEHEFRDLPEKLRQRLVSNLEQHLGEVDAHSTPELVATLGQPEAYAHDLLAAMDLPLPNPSPSKRRWHRIPTAYRVVGMAAAVAIVGLAAFLGIHAGTTAKPDVLSNLPSQTGAIQVVTGTTGDGHVFTLWAKITRDSAGRAALVRVGNPQMPLVFNNGLCTAIAIAQPHGTGAPAFVGGGSGPCLLPTKTRIDLGGIGPGTEFQTAILSGVTREPATSIRIEYRDIRRPPLIVKTATADLLPGVHFFAVDVHTYEISTVTALDVNGHALFTTPYPPPS